MSWNDQDIDNLFKNAKGPEVPPFEEEFWAEMEAMLPAQQKNRKPVIWWTSGIAVALLLTAGVFIMQQADAEQSAAGKNAATAAAQHTAPNPAAPSTAFVNTAKDPSETVAAPHELAAFPPNENRTPQLQSRRGVPSADGSNPELTPTEYQAPASPNTEAQQPSAPAPEERFKVDRLKPLALTCEPVYITRKFKDPVYRSERFYMQTSAGFGQSPQHNVSSASGLMHYYTLGAGLFKRMDHVVFTYGVNGRVDFSRNIISRKASSPSHRIDTRYSELYSFEMPASFGYEFGRNAFVASVTPGFQFSFSGKRTEFEDNVAVRSERIAGKTENTKTLTMELGLSYWRTLQPNLYLGAGINADAIRPFSPGNFVGDQRKLPFNGQIILRKTF